MDVIVRYRKCDGTSHATKVKRCLDVEHGKRKMRQYALKKNMGYINITNAYQDIFDMFDFLRV